MPLDVSRAPASASPLWIIALFIALSEATAGVAAITTSGSARLIFACFAVAFPTLVFAVFIWLLVKHAPKLYAPGQYSREITPEIYRAGISQADAQFIGRALAKTVVPLLDDLGDDESDREAAVEQVVLDFEAAFRESSIEIEVVPPQPDDESLRIPVTAKTPVGNFLDMVWFELKGRVAPYTYGGDWVLISCDSEKRYSDMGTSWAHRHGLKRDTRPIPEVGIKPGDCLRAIIKSEVPSRKR
jgi:hypothetical protein